jgi:hypothetical protein
LTTYTKLTIGGTQFDDYKNMKISRTIHDANASSSFTATFDSPYGRHKTDFTIGQEIIVYSSDTPNPVTIIFIGILEKINFSGEGTTQDVTLEGRDYSLRLMDMTIKPIVYTNEEISDIVKDIITSNDIPDITTNHVQVTAVTLKRIGFNQTPAFDGIAQLANLSSDDGYIFYVDNQKDLHFEPNTTVNSGITLDNTNLVSCDFDKSRQEMYNIVYVYGDRYLSNVPPETYYFGSPIGMSGITLINKPHNTQVSYLGSTLKGSIEGMSINPISGTDYGVSFDDRQIIMYSGADFPNFPGSGGSIVVNYARDLPIIKAGQDNLSVQLYGPKELKIQDTTIKDPATATTILRNRLLDSNPLDRITCLVKKWLNINPGDLIHLTLDNFNINQDFNIVQIDYEFDPFTIQNDHIIHLTLGNKPIDITDRIKNLKSRIDAIESQNIQATDIITRLLTTSSSFNVTGSRWNVGVRYIGSDYLWGVSQSSKPFVWGVTGSGLWLGSYAYPNFVRMYSGT